jgi:SAM-dependent methyltransferase
VLTAALVAALGSADVTATDLNDAMVDVGRANTPGATWRQADAMDLPFENGQFDLVACEFGVMFFPDKPAAFAEARRVLSADGTLLVSIWDTVETNAFAAAVIAGLGRAFPDDPPDFLESVPYGYADIDAIVADVRAGGLEPATVESVALDGLAASAADVASGFCTGTPLRAGIEARGDLAEVTAIVTETVEARFGPGAVAGRMTAHVIEARPAT